MAYTGRKSDCLWTHGQCREEKPRMWPCRRLRANDNSVRTLCSFKASFTCQSKRKMVRLGSNSGTASCTRPVWRKRGEQLRANKEWGTTETAGQRREQNRREISASLLAPRAMGQAHPAVCVNPSSAQKAGTPPPHTHKDKNCPECCIKT